MCGELDSSSAPAAERISTYNADGSLLSAPASNVKLSPSFTVPEKKLPPFLPLTVIVTGDAPAGLPLQVKWSPCWCFEAAQPLPV